MPDREARRLKALQAYQILDTPSDPAFDRIADLAADMFDAPMAAICFVDDARAWFKAKLGFTAESADRANSAWEQGVISAPEGEVVVIDASADADAGSADIAGASPIRFFAGVALTAPCGANLGMLCVMDDQPRAEVPARKLKYLRKLAAMAMDELELHKLSLANRRTLELFDLAQQFSGIGHWHVRRGGEEVVISDQVGRIFGLDPSAKSIDAQDILHLCAAEDRQAVLDKFSEAFRLGGGFDARARLTLPDGATRTVECKGAAEAPDANGVVRSVFGVIKDVTDELKAKESAERNYARFRLLADNMADVVTRVRADGSSGYISPAIEALIGYRPEEMQGKTAFDFVYPPDRPLLYQALARLLAGEDDIRLEHRAQHRHGHPIWVETRVKRLNMGAGGPPEMIATIRDISERRKLEQSLKQTLDELSTETHRLKMAEEIAGLGRWSTTRDVPTVNLSEAARRILGLSGQAPMARTEFLARVETDDVVDLGRDFGEFWTTDASSKAIDLRYRRPDGELRYLRLSGVTERDDQGRVMSVSGLVLDLTDIVTARNALSETEARYQLIAENAEEVVVQLDTTGRALFVSPAAAEILGYPAEDLIGRFASDVICPEDIGRIASDFKQVLKTGISRPCEYRIQRKDGEVIWVQARPRRLLDPNTGEVLGTADTLRDVTQQRALAAKVAADERLYRWVIDNSRDTILHHDLEGHITFVSKAIEDFGLSAEQMVGMDAFSLVHPDDVASVRAHVQRLVNNEVEGEVREFRVRHPSGDYIWIEGNASVLRNEAGEAVGVANCLREVTERRAMIEALRAARDEAERASMIKSEFIANVSHELRTPLTAVIGFGKLIDECLSPGHMAKTYSQKVVSAGETLLALINDVLDFSKLEAGELKLNPQPTELRAEVQETVSLFELQAAHKGVLLRLEGLETLPEHARIDGGRLKQVLLNLIGNAVKFTSLGHVSVRAAYDEQAARLTVAVVDTGPGIAEDAQQSLFQRFSQADASLTKRFGGTGLGLAIAKRLALAMGGDIRVESQVGVGSIFTATFDCPLDHSAAAETPATPNAPDLQAARLLVVDDNPNNRELVRAILSPLGLAIVEASGGHQAIRLCQAEVFDVILMDLRMPDLDGRSAAEAIRKSGGPNAAARILAFSADIHVESLGAPFDGVIAKPLRPHELVEKLFVDEGEAAIASARAIHG